MEQKEFFETLKKYRLGKASDEEKRMIDAWYEAIGKKSDEVSNIREEELAKRYWSSISIYISNQENQVFKSEKSANEVPWNKGMDQNPEIQLGAKVLGTCSNECGGLGTVIGFNMRSLLSFWRTFGSVNHKLKRK